MALYNEILTGRHNRFFQKLFGLKGGPPAPQLSSEVSISQPIFHGPENRFIESWYLYGCAGSQGAVAAFNSRFELRNPGNSGMLAVIELWITTMTVSATLDIQYGQPGTDLGTVFIARARDGRQKGRPACVFSCDATVAAGQIGTSIMFATNPIGSLVLPNEESQQLVLSPGDSVVWQDSTVNQAFTVGVWWRERPIEEGELR